MSSRTGVRCQIADKKNIGIKNSNNVDYLMSNDGFVLDN